RAVNVSTVDGDMVSRSEIFDEADLDAALGRFDELDRPAPLLGNAATQLWVRLADAFNRRDLAGFLALSTAGLRYEDRRKGLRDEFEGASAQRKSVLAMFEASPSSVQMTAEPIAIRGSRLSLNHVCYRDTEYDDQPITVEMLQIVEVSEAGLLHFSVSFDPDDVDAAFAELDARCLAGEAAAHARTWSAIAGVYSSFNRHELPATTSDWVTIDHRPLATFEYHDPAAFFGATWDLTPQTSIYIETLHRLNGFGAVVTHKVYGTSQDGFDAEWRQISVLTAQGDLINRCAIFDKTELDAAIARFEELQPQTPRLENAASRTYDRFNAYFAARDWDPMSWMISTENFNHD